MGTAGADLGCMYISAAFPPAVFHQNRENDLRERQLFPQAVAKNINVLKNRNFCILADEPSILHTPTSWLLR